MYALAARLGSTDPYAVILDRAQREVIQNPFFWRAVLQVQ
jgi:hypothetical protein